MLTKKQIEELPPKPLVNKIRTKVRFGEDGKPYFHTTQVLTYDPSTGKKVNVRERGFYSNTELIKLFGK